MYSQTQGIYFSHTAILSGPSFSESLATDTAPSSSSSSSSKDGRTAGESIDDFNSAFNSAGGGKKDYDVFLSFRGEDTRNIFTGHLYEALTNAGINTFIDNEELPRGETINKELERAIEGSRTSIVVFSRNYADSTWCLEELSKIMDCRRTLGQLVFPVFYGVDPSEVRKQTGNFGKALMRHEARFLRSDSDVKKEELDPWRLALFYVKWKLAHTKANVNRWKLALAQVKLKQEWDKWKLALFQAMLNREMNRWKFRLNGATLRRWKSALTEAANLSGWDSSVIRNDAKLIKVIVNDILRRTLSMTNLHVAPHPVGMYFRVQKLRSLLKLGLDDHEVRFVGISGMAGVGKTTIAKAMYNVFHSQFGNNRSFLENVRHNWDQPHCQVRLQKQLLSHILKKKVDWVDSVDKGIQVIKDKISGKRVLVVLDDVDHREQLDALTGSRDWFGPGSIIIITTRNQQLLKELNVDATYMAPEMNEIESLELFCWHAFGAKRPNAEYIELSKSVVNYCGGLPLALRVLGSYFKGMSSKAMWISELEKLKKIPHKDILKKLRISFDGLGDDTVKDIFLDISCFFIGMDLNYVQDILDGCGLYAETGLWRLLELCLITVNERNKIMMHDLLRDMGRAIVQENLTNRPGQWSRLWFHEDVSGVLMDGTGTENIEGLALDREKLEMVSFTTEAFMKMKRLRLLQLNFVQLTGSYEYLSKNLRWLCWNKFPLDFIPSNFYQGKLVAMNLKYSNLRQVWKGPQMLKELKILNLSHSNYLSQTPDFSNLPNLRQLILKYCKKLSEVHPSIGNLEGLVLVNLKDCEILKKLPRNFYKLRSLKTLILSGCSMFNDLDEDIGDMVSLKILHADNTGIREVPQTIGELSNLTDLSLCGLKASPGNLGTFRFWSRFIMPRKNSKPVNLLPPSLQGLKSLTRLSLMDCNLTEDAIPKDFGSLPSLVTLRLDKNSFRSLPFSLKGLSRLRSLSLDNCTLLESILDLPTNLKALYAANCTALKIVPNMSEMANLVILELANCHELVNIPGLDKLLKSVSLQLQDKNSTIITGKKRFSQVLTSTEFASLFLDGDDIPVWFTCIATGSSVSFEVPLLVDSSLKGCLVRTVYSYSPKPTLFSAFPSILVTNKTQRESFIFDLIALSHHGTTCEGHIWQGLVSNDVLKLKDGDKVEVILNFGEHYMVMKTGVFLLFDKQVKSQMNLDLYDLEREAASPAKRRKILDIFQKMN